MQTFGKSACRGRSRARWLWSLLALGFVACEPTAPESDEGDEDATIEVDTGLGEPETDADDTSDAGSDPDAGLDAEQDEADGQGVADGEVSPDSLGPAGGRIVHLQLTLEVPAGALATTTAVAVTALSAPPPPALGPKSALYMTSFAAPLLQPARISFETSDPGAIVYASNPHGEFVALETTWEAGRASAEVSGPGQLFLGSAAQASGETCASAIALGSAPLVETFTLSERSADQAQPSVCTGSGAAQQADVVYRWRPASDGYVRVSVEGISGVRMTLYVDASCEDESYVRCNAPAAASVELAVDADFDYHIVISSDASAMASEQGTLRLVFNADCANVDQTNCSGTCVNLAANDMHCGACGDACAAHAHCEGSQCACDQGYTQCGDECVDTGVDERYCGGCGHACNADERCLEGQCHDNAGETCAAATRILLAPPTVGSGLRAEVSSPIVDAHADIELPRLLAAAVGVGSSHAPVRDRAWVWNANEALDVYLSGYVARRTQPFRPNFFSAIGVYKDGCSPQHLIAGRTAHDFTMQFRSVPGSTYYFVAFMGPWYADSQLTDARLSIAATSATSTGCASGTTECGGGCVDLATSAIHCGSCGHSCGSGASCQAGSCVCSVQTLCDDTCVNLQTDPLHCGQCGHACAADSLCLNGACASPGVGLSCATAIEVSGNPMTWPRFSMQGAESAVAWPRECSNSPGTTTHARLLKLQPANAGTLHVSVSSRPRTHVNLALLSEAQCQAGGPPLACTFEGGEIPALLSTSYQANQATYVLVSEWFDGAREGFVEFYDF